MNSLHDATLAGHTRLALRALGLSHRKVACYTVGTGSGRCCRIVVRDEAVNVAKLVSSLEGKGLCLTADGVNAAPGTPCFTVTFTAAVA